MDYIPASAQGEKCRCGAAAARKVEEVIFSDDPHPIRHPFTTYICLECFELLMHPAADDVP